MRTEKELMMLEDDAKEALRVKKPNHPPTNLASLWRLVG